MLKVTNEIIEKVNDSEIRIDKINVEPSIVSYSYDITIYGHTVPKTQWFRESGDNLYISAMKESKNVAYRISINYQDFMMLDFNSIIEIIYQRIPPEFEIDIHKIIDKVYEEYRKKHNF